MHTIKRKSRESRKCMKVKRGTSEKYKEYPFKPCSQNGSVPSLHSLSIRLFRKHCKLTIFNSFNFIAHEFSAGGKFTRNFRSIQVLSKRLYFNTLQTYRKPTGKRRRFDGRGNLLIILKVPFCTKITSKHEKIPPKFSFYTLISLLRK